MLSSQDTINYFLIQNNKHKSARHNSNALKIDIQMLWPPTGKDNINIRSCKC